MLSHSSMADIESDTAQLLGSNVARRGKRGKRRNHDHVSNGQSMSVLSDPEGVLMDDEAQEVQQMKRLRVLSGSHGDSLPSVRAQLAASMYAESKQLHKRSSKESTPLLFKTETEKEGVPNDSSSDSIVLKGSYDTVVLPPPASDKGSRFGNRARKW